MSVVRIALAQLPFPQDGPDALAHAGKAIRAAAEGGAEVVCFPECYFPQGYRNGSTVVPYRSIVDAMWDGVAQAAADAHVAVVLGTERPVEGHVRISTLVIDPAGNRLGFQDKVQLDPSEDAAYEPGTGRRIFDIGHLKFGIAICHEGWRYPETVRWAARRGAHVVFHPHFHGREPGACRPATFADPANTFHEKAALCRAAENTIYFATVNYAVEGSPTTSAVVNPNGTLLCYQPYGQAGLLFADIDTHAATGLLAQRHRPDPVAS